MTILYAIYLVLNAMCAVVYHVVHFHTGMLVLVWAFCVAVIAIVGIRGGWQGR